MCPGARTGYRQSPTESLPRSGDMHWRRRCRYVACRMPRPRSLLLFLLAALVVLVPGSGASISAPPPRVLASFPGVARAVAFDGRRVAWIETTWEIRLKTTTRPQSTRVIRYTSQYHAFFAERYPWLLLGGDRIAWLSTRSVGGAGFDLIGRVYETSAAT